ncbi:MULTISPECIES: LuxR C-terminal-related transcriptional regulator [Burkholderia]|uniref:LuxR family transcriptional regulator n=1 Tax=Burkholderia aenigmatica TaxID=2015348 RepID=A0A228IZ68_9BURK|nr:MULTISPECIES: LuxR C-terminal-related transcriptional regulator [Burkholderia]MBN3840115.1 LuxR family transcriptional regulator [Burkholderia sp. Ac-20349]OXI47385.1 LuxR family transcriptional regulator [Burkholderia aenigmatica]VWB90041.1 LuxR family transcriptional regulator [Burkholderia aenigmatica]
MSDKHVALASHIRRLCSLGVEPRLVIPHVIEAARHIVGADWGMFFYADEHYALSDVYSENDTVYTVLPSYFMNVHNTARQEVLGVTFSDAMRRGRGFVNSAHYDDELLSSEMYADLWQPTSMRHCLELTATDGTRGWGSLQLSRAPGSRPFSEKNHRDIEPVARHLAHALSRPAQLPLHEAEGSLSAIVVVDGAGRLLLHNTESIRMLSLATGEPLAFYRHDHLPDWLAPLLSNVNRIWRGHPAPPATLERRNTAGRFRFKAYRLADARPVQRDFSIVIYIEHFPPLELEIERLGFEFGLTERQRELCTQLVLGRSHSEIASGFALRNSTVIDHVRKIYRKLNVHNHDELRSVFRAGSHD